MTDWDKGREIHLRLRAEGEGRKSNVIKTLKDRHDLRQQTLGPGEDDPGGHSDPSFDRGLISLQSGEGSMKRDLHDEASEVEAEDGEVEVDGPAGVGVSLTPEAALETGRRLIEKSAEAAGQRHWKEAAAIRPTAERE